MKVIRLIIFLLGTGSHVCQAQVTSYDLSSVSETVKKNASVIKRYENIVLTVESISKANYSVHKIYTVVNEEGKAALQFSEYTTKFMNLGDAEVKVYDALGKQIHRYKRKDMSTIAVGDGLIEDGYRVYLQIPVSVFPVTVEVKYDFTFTGTLMLPDYYISTHGEGVENSNFTFRIPADLSFRYKTQNIELKPDISTEGKYQVYKWTAREIAPMDYEEGAVSYKNRFPSVILALNKFSHYGYEGDMSSWQNFGNWLSNLYKGLDALPQQRKDFFIHLVKDASSDEEKIRIIYNYLQKNFRYVSIQLGIGGLRPFSAQFTDEKKYGDCKSLSNYMKSALEAVGIRSHLAIINSGYNDLPVDPDFPANDFNHVILCVPLQNDSIWLECTSSTSEFAELGTFTENKNALLITEAGGKLVPTPASHSKANRLYSKTIVQMEDDAYGTTETIYRSSGVYREQMEFILGEKREDQKESVVYTLSFKQPDDFLFERMESKDMHTMKLRMEIEKVPEFTAGSKLFLAPRLHKIWKHKLPKAENRTLDFYFRFPFEMVDTTIYKLPGGYKADVMPPDKELSCAYGKYSSKSWYEESGNAIISAVSIELFRHRIPAADYAEVKKFFDDIILTDAQRIVVKKE